MSPTHKTTPASLNIQALLGNAMATYKKYTGQDLRNHPLATMIDRGNSLESILAILREQAQAIDEFKNGDSELIKRLTPIVNTLHAISTHPVHGAVVRLAFPQVNIILSVIVVLLSTPRFLEQGHDVLIDIFKCINIFLSLLKIYADIPPTLAMTAMVVQILLELLAVLAIATKQIGQGRFEIYARKRLGEKDIESILQRFDRLTLDGSTMTVAQTLGAVYALVNDMRVVMEDEKASTDVIRQTLVLLQALVMKVNKIERSHLQAHVRHRLSVPDPSTNYNTARKTRRRGTAKL